MSIVINKMLFDMNIIKKDIQNINDQIINFIKEKSNLLEKEDLISLAVENILNKYYDQK